MYIPDCPITVKMNVARDISIGNYIHLDTTFRCVSQLKGGGDSTEDGVRGLFLRDLHIWSQGDAEHVAKGEGLYAISLRYKNVDVDESNADDYCKTLKRLRTALDKIVKSMGPPETYGHLVARVATIVKAEAVYVHNGRCEEGIHYADPGEAVWAINTLYHDWAQAFRP